VSGARAAPPPRVLYVHDDLTAEVARRRGACSPESHLVADLFALIRRHENVIVLELDTQIDGLLATGPRQPFPIAVGIGRAGEIVARDVHARAGWFPVVRRVEVAREETEGGDYVLACGPVPLAEQLSGVEAFAAVAVVDDTIFSGLTMDAVLRALPPGVLSRTMAFCLRAVAESLPAIARRCPVSVGFAAPGRILDDVSFINASGLVKRGAIRRTGLPPLAFFERPEWIALWFPKTTEQILGVCRELNARLD
jgi:hypothetical protein